MNSANLDPSAIFHRALDMATQSLRIEKVLTHFGLEPGPVQTLDAASALSLVAWTRRASN